MSNEIFWQHKLILRKGLRKGRLKLKADGGLHQNLGYANERKSKARWLQNILCSMASLGTDILRLSVPCQDGRLAKWAVLKKTTTKKQIDCYCINVQCLFLQAQVDIVIIQFGVSYVFAYSVYCIVIFSV